MDALPQGVIIHLRDDHEYCWRFQSSLSSKQREEDVSESAAQYEVVLMGISEPPITVFVSLPLAWRDASYQFSELQQSWRTLESRGVPCYTASLLHWVQFLFLPLKACFIFFHLVVYNDTIHRPVWTSLGNGHLCPLPWLQAFVFLEYIETTIPP